MKEIICAVILIGLMQSAVLAQDKHITKRQIYREQVLPHSGGKIPDAAFQSDRLLLNQLQKEGISIPDGVVLQQRNPQVHPYLNRASRTVFRVAITSDGRYTPLEGRYFYDKLPSQETTYLYPQIHNHPLYAPSSLNVNFPKYRPITLPNQYLTQEPLKPKKKTVYYVTYSGKPAINPAIPISSSVLQHQKQQQQHQQQQLHYNPSIPVSNSIVQQYSKQLAPPLPPQPSVKTVKTYNVINNPLNSFSWSQLQQDYITSQIFNDFDGFFNDYKLREVRSPSKNYKNNFNDKIK